MGSVWTIFSVTMMLVGVFVTVAAGTYSILYDDILYDDPEPTYQQYCQYWTVEWMAIQACWSDNVCNLSNDEMLGMYRARKQSIMMCKRQSVTGIFEDAKKKNEELQVIPMPEVEKPEVPELPVEHDGPI